jgi:hypothetical protein
MTMRQSLMYDGSLKNSWLFRSVMKRPGLAAAGAED